MIVEAVIRSEETTEKRMSFVRHGLFRHSLADLSSANRLIQSITLLYCIEGFFFGIHELIVSTTLHAR